MAMAARDDSLLAEIELEDLILSIDGLARLLPAMRKTDAELAARLMVAAGSLRPVLAEMSFKLSRVTSCEPPAQQPMGKTVHRWASRKGAAAVLLTEDGELFRRDGVGVAWAYHSTLRDGQDALEVVKAMPGGPWRHVQGGKMFVKGAK